MTSTSPAPRRGTRTRRPVARLDAALWAAARGWHVFPLSPGTKYPVASCDECSSSSPTSTYDGHQPEDCPHPPAGLHCHSLYAATVNEQVIRSWWQENPRYNIGVHAGRSGLLILDLDRHPDTKPPHERDLYLPGVDLPSELDVQAELRDGVDVLTTLAAIRGKASPLEDPATLVVTTPSGGLHLWYQAPEGTLWRRGASRLGWQIDVLAGLSYTIMPGTNTSKGTYTRTSTATLPIELPPWLATDLERVGLREDNRPKPAEPRPAPPSAKRSSSASAPTGANGKAPNPAYLDKIVDDELATIRAAQHAGWNEAIYWASYRLGRLVGGGYLDEAVVEADLTSAADPDTHVDRQKAAATIRSGLRNGINKPRTLDPK